MPRTTSHIHRDGSASVLYTTADVVESARALAASGDVLSEPRIMFPGEPGSFLTLTVRHAATGQTVTYFLDGE